MCAVPKPTLGGLECQRITKITGVIDKLGSVTIPSNPSETNTKVKADEQSKYFAGFYPQHLRF